MNFSFFVYKTYIMGTQKTILTSGLSVLIHGVISLLEPMSYDKMH